MQKSLICGLDEVGRGPLAGPIVAAAVILIKPIKGLNDSKKLTPQKRSQLYKKIKNSQAVIAIEEIGVSEINRKGIAWANKEIFMRLMKKIPATKYIIDGNLKIKNAQSLIKADTQIPEVMAASIIAKVWRDRLMKRMDKEFPGYGFSHNMGYGTKHHLLALEKLGLCKHHRKLFAYTALNNMSNKKSGTSR